MKVLDELVFIADSLDQRGLHEEASLVDLFLCKKGSVFSLFEREAISSIVSALNELKKQSVISTPLRPLQLLSLQGRRVPLKGNIAENYLTIYEWLSTFISEILRPNAEAVPDNEFYQGLLEFTTYLKNALEGQYSRLLSIKSHYESFVKAINKLSQLFNSLTVNAALLDEDRIENVADKLDEIKQQYSALLVPLRRLNEVNINIDDLESIIEDLGENLKIFLEDQSKEGDTLRSFLENAEVVSKTRDSKGERALSFNWILENAKQVGPEAGKLAEQYKAVDELKRGYRRQRMKAYSDLEKLIDILQDKYNYWMTRFKNEGIDEYNVDSVFNKYGGFENFLNKVQFALEVYSPEQKVETSSYRILSKNAQEEFGLVPIEEGAQVKEMEKLIERILEAKTVLEKSSQKWERSIGTSQALFKKLSEEVKEALVSGHMKKDWNLFKKQVDLLVEQAEKQFELVAKNDKKVSESLVPKIDSYNRVINLLFKY